MKSLLEKFEEFSIAIHSISEAVLNFCKAIFFMAATITSVYSSIHLHKLLTMHDTLKTFLSK